MVGRGGNDPLVAIFLEEWNGMVGALEGGRFGELNVGRDAWRLGEMGCPAVLSKELECVGVLRSAQRPRAPRQRLLWCFPRTSMSREHLPGVQACPWVTWDSAVMSHRTLWKGRGVVATES